MNIEIFKGSFDNVARPNLFQVSGFGLPADLELRVKAASLPVETMGTIEVPHQSRRVKLPGDRTYEPWTITVINTTDFNVYDAFIDWNRSLNSPIANVGNSGNSNKRDGLVEQLDTFNSVVKSIEIRGAFPAIIGAIELDWENQNAIETFEVTMEYDYHL